MFVSIQSGANETLPSPPGSKRYRHSPARRCASAICLANDREDADIAQAPTTLFRSLLLSGPDVVAVDLTKDRQQLRDIISETRRSGKVVTNLPKHYVPYAQQVKTAASQRLILQNPGAKPTA